MGHLTLITEEVVTALERFPPELRAEIDAHIPKPDWDDYVLGKHQKTRERNNRLLGGGKPVISQDPLREARWKVDEEEEVAKDATRSSGSSGEGSFTRATSSKPSPRQTADFGPPDAADSDPGENTAPQVMNHPRAMYCRYYGADDTSVCSLPRSGNQHGRPVREYLVRLRR